MKFGLTEEEFELLHELLIEPLKNQNCEVWIFGSRSRGDHRKFSDIDLLYQVPHGKNLPSGFLSSILENAEESRLNYKIDLVSTGDLASSYQANVDREKIRL
jgi:predicted nucleotidyltransferase